MEYIDVRSDTVTQPTLKMREAMSEHNYGYPNEDKALKALLDKATKMFGMEAALMIPSGVMSNQIAVLSWTKPGDEIILEDNCHIMEMQNGTIANLSGVAARAVKAERGQLTPQLIQPYIKLRNVEEDQPGTRLICIENSLGNGRLYSLQNLRNLRAFATKYSISIHTDGARIFHAAAALNTTVSKLATYTDSICFCLSKGLCAPYGSILLGTHQFIHTAKKNMQMLIGKEYNPAALFPSAGLIALEQMSVRVGQDNKMAKMIAKRLGEIRGVVIDVEAVMANIVFFSLNEGVRNQEKLVEYMIENGVKFGGYNTKKVFRIIAHYYIGERQAEQVLRLLKEFIDKNQ